MLAAKCCKVRQILRSLEFLKAKQRCFHKDMFLHRCLHIHMHVSTNCFYTLIPSRTSVFTQGCFYTKNAHRRASTSTRRCLHTAMLLQRNAFTRFYTGLLVTQNSLYAEAFTVNTLPQRCFCTEIHLYKKCFFTHRYFYKEVFLHEYFGGEMLLHAGALRLGRI